MAGLGTLLRELHRIHRQYRDLREILDRIPVQLKIQRTKTARHEDALKQGQEGLKRVKVTIKEKESELKSKGEQIDKYERQINTVTEMKEYRALKTEIAGGKEACARLEDEILHAMGEVDERTAALPELEKNAKTAREDLARFESTSKEKEAGLREQLGQVEAKLKETEKGLPEEYHELYNRLVNARGADALAPVRGRICSACSTEITNQQRAELALDRWLVCPACDRILYMPEESSAPVDS
jgi:predicted  nucleic acid-binding Zn-ribbon protein